MSQLRRQRLATIRRHCPSESTQEKLPGWPAMLLLKKKIQKFIKIIKIINRFSQISQSVIPTTCIRFFAGMKMFVHITCYNLWHQTCVRVWVFASMKTFGILTFVMSDMMHVWFFVSMKTFLHIRFFFEGMWYVGRIYCEAIVFGFHTTHCSNSVYNIPWSASVLFNHTRMNGFSCTSMFLT